MSDKKLLKRFLSNIKDLKPLIALSFAAAVIYSAFAMFIPYFAGKAIDCITGDIDFGLLFKNLLICLLLIAFAAVFQLVLNLVNNKIAYQSTLRLRDKAYLKVGKLPIAYIDASSAGTLQSMIISDCETIGDGLILFLNQFFSGLTAILFTLGIMLYIDVKIALFVLIFTPVSFIFSYFIAKGSFKSFKEQASIRSRQTSYISEMTSNYKVGHAFGIKDDICDGFNVINEKYKKTSGHANFLSSITNPTTRFVNALIYAGVAFIGSGLVVKNTLSVGELSSLLAYATQFMKPFNDLSSVYTELSDSFACLDRIFNFLDETELDDDLSGHEFDYPWDDKGDFEIEFKNVSFSYVPGKKVLKDVSFKVPSGCSCAIVGPTGCGKTTIINLLMRFYEPDSGSILVNGRDISEVPRNVLRKYIGMVSQDTWFRDASVMDNIKYGNPDAEDSVAYESASKTGADSFIRKLPGKYNEPVDSSRDDISAGQRQLLSITRAMASDPSILILDEATSSVDILTEVKIQKAVKELLEGRTSIIIAHRLSTIIDADMIVVIEGGSVSEIGKHSELISAGGFYSKLYASYTD